MQNNRKLVTIIAGIMAGVMLLSLVLGLVGSLASAASSSEIQQQIDELKEEKEAADAELAELEALLSKHLETMSDMLNQKNALDHQISLLNSQVTTISQMLSAYNLMIADKQEELDRAEARLEELNEKYRRRLRVMEEQGSLSYWSVIFNASSFADLLDRLNMVNEIAYADARRLDELREAAKTVENNRAELLTQKQEMENTKRSLQAMQQEMLQKQAEADKLLAELVALGTEYLEYIEAAEDRQAELMLQLAQKDNELDEAKYREWLATSVPPTSTSTSSGHVTNTVNGITWYTPTKNYVITSLYGPRVHPITGEVGKMHWGIDMAAATGTPVYATRGGVVTAAAFQDGGAGHYVKINHGDGFGSVYMHMTHFVVSVGDYVSAGQVIGYVGSTGGSTGPHLHFGISIDGYYVDPLKYIKT